jgi:alpha-amylase
LIALSAALHARGMYLMVDIVTNHMGYLGCGTCVDYSVFTPFNSVGTSPPPAPNDCYVLIRESNLTIILSASLIITMLPVSKSVGKETIPSLSLI